MVRGKSGDLGSFAPLRAHTVADEADGSHKPRRRRKARGRAAAKPGGRWGPEADQQKLFVVWARGKGLELQHQNNGSNSKTVRIHLHAMGCTAGAADLLIFDQLPRCPEARGLALEFKSSNGDQSPDQIGWQQRLERLGWRYHVVRSAEEAVEVVTWYGLPTTNPGADL